MRSLFIFLILSLPVAVSHAQAAPPVPSVTLSNDSKLSTLSTLDTATPSPALLPPPVQEIQDDLPRIPTVDLTIPPDDLWQRVRNGFAMPDLDSALVADRQAWYLNRPDFLRNVFNRSRRYLYHIVTELEKRGMPTELALLPIVESAYNPQARSPASALGIWQFIPSTGRNYNLKQNAWFDERRDIIASTKAALDYLQYIYEMHGDWQLALASYNWGEGAVGRAIAKNQAKGLPTDYTHLSMPGETRYYVPKLQAIKNIVANPALFGFTLDPIPNHPYFQVIERNGDMDIALAARLAEIPVTEFLALNPAYNRPVMPDSANSPMVIPSDKVKIFLDNLHDHEAQDKPLSAWRTHTLARGEKLNTVARRYGISVAYLKQLNGLSRRSKIYPGFGLLVPGKGAVISDDLSARAEENEPHVSSRRSSKHKVHGKKTGKRGAVAARSGAKKSVAKGHRVSVSIRKSGKSTSKPTGKKKARR
ncbi:MAG: LysM peptidoglycan-binding domain-containing protein [Rugosibacter sp.]|nr:MAG: LysM peptidoglycan-binding domain-containing protein [Rugosibacter sp.]